MNDLRTSDPPLRGTYYRDERGMPHADFDSPCEVVGWFLEQDVQNSVSTCDELIAIVDETKASRSRYHTNGNAHTITIDDGGVRIETDYADPARSAILTLDEFRRAVLDWKVLVVGAPADR